jgi:hypothetical protein
MNVDSKESHAGKRLTHFLVKRRKYVDGKTLSRAIRPISFLYAWSRTLQKRDAIKDDTTIHSKKRSAKGEKLTGISQRVGSALELKGAVF